MEVLDEYDLILEADKRMDKPGKYLSAKQVLDKLGISESELDSD
jgi:predicted DNA-binding transcriptional regulator AlpA